MEARAEHASTTRAAGEDCAPGRCRLGESGHRRRVGLDATYRWRVAEAVCRGTPSRYREGRAATRPAQPATSRVDRAHLASDLARNARGRHTLEHTQLGGASWNGQVA